MSEFGRRPTWRRLCALVVLFATALFCQPAAAVTTVTVDGRTLVIHVPIDVRGLRSAKIIDIATGERFDAASYIERAVERIWNEAFAGFTYECWKFRLDLELFPIGFESDGVPGHHLITMDMKIAHSYWDATGPDDMEPSRDFPFAYSRDMTGVFNTPDPAVLAHEIGHALGLGDDYLGRNVFKPEAGGIADRAGGVEFVDAEGNTVQPGSFMTRGIGRPEPVHLYRVVKMMQEAGVLPPCLPAYVWVGRIEVDNVFAGKTLAMDVHGRHTWRGVYDVKFLERWTQHPSSVSGLSGESFPVNEVVPLEMNYTIKADHHHDYDHRHGDVVLRGEAAGTLTAAALKDALRGSILRLEPAAPAVDSAPPAQPGSFAAWQDFHAFMSGFYTAPRPGCYQLSIAFGGTGQPPNEVRALYQGINRSGSSPIHPNPDADFLRVMPSHMPDGTNVLGCLEAPEQSEVKGEYSYPSADPGPLNNADQITIRWSFTRCREGVACAATRVSEPASPSPPGLCPEPRNQTARLQLGLAQQKSLKERLDAQRRGYDALARQAEQWENDFKHASRDCSLWSKALTLAGFLAGRGPTTTTTRGVTSNPGEAFNNFLNLIDKISVGDPSWMLPDVESDALPSVETAWDAFRAGYETLGPAAPEQMLSDLRSCGAPTIDGVMDGAVTYVRLLQQIQPMMQDVRKTLNDLRAKDNELLNLWSAYHRACLEYAKCKKLPPSMCDAVPAAR